MTSVDETIETVWMEMTEPPAGAPPPAVEGAELRRAAPPTLAFYRFLHAQVGASWGWEQHVTLPDAELSAVLADPALIVLVLWVDGNPAGFAELDGRAGDEVEIVHFGLASAFLGRGLGPWFLRQVLDFAWRARPRRIWLHTDECDHPKAQATYAAAGFKVFQRTREPGSCCGSNL
jgi:GNAT superfamily N-acetyltransferase